MYRSFLSAVAASAILLGGCGGSDPGPEQRAAVEMTDTVATAAQDPHAGHAMPDADSAAAGAAHDMTGMDHGRGATAGSARATGHAGTTHGPGAVATDHTAHTSGPGRATAAGDHAQHTGTPARGDAASADHSAAGHTMAPAPAGRTSTAEQTRHQPSADHASHASPSTARAPAPGRLARPAAATDPHAGHIPARPGTETVEGTKPGTDKLLTLVSELVQDSVVQRRIERDPVLRELWRDSGVRRVIQQRRD